MMILGDAPELRGPTSVRVRVLSVGALSTSNRLQEERYKSNGQRIEGISGYRKQDRECRYVKYRKQEPSDASQPGGPSKAGPTDMTSLHVCLVRFM